MILLDADMPLDHVQKFLRHKRIATTQTYAETSVRCMGETYHQALEPHERTDSGQGERRRR